MHQETFELNCSRTSLAMDGTLVVVVEMSLSTWLVCAEVPGLERRAMMKMSVDEAELLSQLHRWRDEAEKRADCRVSRICVAYEAGRDGFWLARCLRGNGIEAHVMHSTSIPVKRDHRRAKTDRLDCQLMMRAFPGWLLREEGHCRMVAVPTAEQEDARRVTRERAACAGRAIKPDIPGRMCRDCPNDRRQHFLAALGWAKEGMPGSKNPGTHGSTSSGPERSSDRPAIERGRNVEGEIKILRCTI